MQPRRPTLFEKSSNLKGALTTMADSQPSPGVGLITATIDAATGQIVEVLSIDAAGATNELTTDRRAKLARQSGGETIEDLVEQAFEAGIAFVLGEDKEDAQASESEEDAALRRYILRPMIEDSSAGRLMHEDVLGRAIVGTLIRDAARGRNGGAKRSRPSPASP
jgi:hypothetical protein